MGGTQSGSLASRRFLHIAEEGMAVPPLQGSPPLLSAARISPKSLQNAVCLHGMKAAAAAAFPLQQPGDPHLQPVHIFIHPSFILQPVHILT